MNSIPTGIWPTMITPYRPDGGVDLDAVWRLVHWYGEEGCNGIFAVCQSSEMFYLTLSERIELAKAVVDATAGTMAVVASSHVSDEPEAQIEELGMTAETGVDAVVMVSNRLAGPDEDDEVWIRNAERILDALPGVRFGIYECPYPYKRLMTDATLEWCMRSGRFVFLKDTCCDAALIKHRIQRIRELGSDGSLSSLKLYNANTLTLLGSLRSGASGYSGVMANLHPRLYSWLFRNWRTAPETAERLQALLTFLSDLELYGYPICAKQRLRDLGLPMSITSRSKPMQAFGTKEREMLRQGELLEELAYGMCGIDTQKLQTTVN